MTFRHTVIYVLACFGLVSAALARQPIPEGGTPLIGGLNEARAVGVDWLDEGGTLRVNVHAVGEHPWSSQLAWRVGAGVEVGDVLLLRVRARAARGMTGEGAIGLNVEQFEGDWAKLATAGHAIPMAWTTLDLPFIARSAYAPGEWQVALHLGSVWQELEIAEVSLLRFPEGTRADDLPRTAVSYVGRESDAAWRTDALERIEALRVSDVVIDVVDEAGQPIVGAIVEAEQTRSAFAFGSAITARHAPGHADADSPYRAIAKEMFNEVVFENAMKWNHHGLGDPVQVEAAVRWALDNGMTLRGHTLVWPGWRWIPERVRALAGDPAALDAAVRERIAWASRYRGVVSEWDAVNEAYANRDLMDILGDDQIATWFELAKQADPDARMFINDYGILTAGRVGSPHQDAYFELIAGLIEEGAPIDGIGMQGHFGGLLTPPTVLLEILDRFATLGLPIKITEYDLDSDDAALQSDYLRDVLITAYSHEAVDGVLVWGFWAGAHWRPAAAMYDLDWNARPHAEVWRSLVLDEWRVVEPARTGRDGSVTLRAHHGSYLLRVTTRKGQMIERTISVGPGSTGERVVLASH